MLFGAGNYSLVPKVTSEVFGTEYKIEHRNSRVGGFLYSLMCHTYGISGVLVWAGNMWLINPKEPQPFLIGTAALSATCLLYVYILFRQQQTQTRSPSSQPIDDLNEILMIERDEMSHPALRAELGSAR